MCGVRKGPSDSLSFGKPFLYPVILNGATPCVHSGGCVPAVRVQGSKPELAMTMAMTMTMTFARAYVLLKQSMVYTMALALALSYTPVLQRAACQGRARLLDPATIIS